MAGDLEVWKVVDPLQVMTPEQRGKAIQKLMGCVEPPTEFCLDCDCARPCDCDERKALEDEVQRLRGMLQERGIDPDAHR